MSAGLQPVNDRDFDRVIAAASVPVLVVFWRPGCGHCRALSVELERVQAHLGEKALVLSMNVEENHQIPAELDIRSLPALALYRCGEFAGFIGGIGKKEEILRHLGIAGEGREDRRPPS